MGFKPLFVIADCPKLYFTGFLLLLDPFELFELFEDLFSKNIFKIFFLLLVLNFDNFFRLEIVKPEFS